MTTAGHRTLLFLPPVLALGIASQIVQVVFLRELLMVFHGSELSLGVILAAWMLWVGAGSRLGGRIAGRFRDPFFPAAAVSLLAVAAPAVTIVLIRALRGFFTIGAGAYFSVYEMAVSSIAVMAPTGLLLGVQFVLLARLWRTGDKAGDTSGAEKAYIGEAAGNLIGGILFSFALVHVFNAFQAVLLGTALMALAIATLMTSPSVRIAPARPGIRTTLFAAFAAGTILLLYLSGPVDRWAHGLQWRHFAPGYELTETRQSRYGTISAAKRADQYSFFQSGHRVFTAAAPEVGRPAMEEQEAVVFAHFAMVQHPEPKRVLLIGGGLRGTIREMAMHPVERIDYIELDPVLTDIARPYIHPSTVAALDGPEVRLIHTDGRHYVKQTENTYDLIIADVPDPATAVLNRYYTGEFFGEVRRILNPGGVFVTGAMSTADLRGERVANRNATIYHTMGRAFPEVIPAGQRFLFFLAGSEKGLVSADPEVLRQRYARRNVEADGFSPRHFELMLEETPLRRMNWIIRNHGRSDDAHLAPPETGPMFPGPIDEQSRDEAALPPVNERFFINSDFKPIGYYHTLRFWDALTAGETDRDSFGWILRVQPWWILPAMAACILLQLVFSGVSSLSGRRIDRRFAVFLAVFTTGLSTMALQVALIFSFQSLYGFVYEMIGLITALFMGGLAAGTLTGRMLIRRRASLSILAGIQFVIAAFALLVGLLLPHAGAFAQPAAVALAIGGLTFFSGALNGVDFPVAAACCQSLDPDPEKATGIVYGVELFGACAGALAASVVVAPVLGITAVCILAAAGNLTAFIALVIASGAMTGTRAGGVFL